MAEIICIECKTSVSDASGYCPNCGYPFDIAQTEQINIADNDVHNTQQKAVITSPLEIILQSLDYVRLEMNELQRTVNDIKQDFDAHAMTSTDITQKTLTDIAGKLDTIASVKCAKETEKQTGAPNNTKKELLAAFYKTLNSPNSMFEYMFYICVVQIIFVIVNLFLVTYVVTLIRR